MEEDEKMIVEILMSKQVSKEDVLSATLNYLEDNDISEFAENQLRPALEARPELATILSSVIKDNWSVTQIVFMALREFSHLEAMEDLVRQIHESKAYKLWIRSLKNGDYESFVMLSGLINLKQGDYYPLYLTIKSGNIKMIAHVEKETGYFKSFDLDINDVTDWSNVMPIIGYRPEVGLDPVLDTIFYKATDFYKKSLLKIMFPEGPSKPDFKAVNFLIRVRPQIDDFPSDKLINFKGKDVGILFPEDVNFASFTVAAELFGPERAIKLMSQPVDANILEDTAAMYREFKAKIMFTKSEKILKKYTGDALRAEFPKKPKNYLKDVHDVLTRVLENIERDPFNLGQGIVKNLEGVSLGVEGLVFSNPVETTDLIECGSSLNICVGSVPSYGKNTLTGGTNITILRNKAGRAIYCIEVYKNLSISQAKGHSNSRVPEEVMEKVIEKIKEHCS